MKGTILESGMIKGDDDKLYTPDMIFEDTILLVCTSWARIPIKDVVGKKVSFQLNVKGGGYNFKLI